MPLSTEDRRGLEGRRGGEGWGGAHVEGGFLCVRLRHSENLMAVKSAPGRKHI